MMHPQAQETNFWPQRTLPSIKKTVAFEQLAALVPVQFKGFQAFQHVPGGRLNRSRYSQASQTSRITKSRTRFAYSNSKSISDFHAYLTCFDCLFVFRMKFRSYLDWLIEI